MQQVATAKGQTILTKPGLPCKEGLEIVFEQRQDALVQHQLIPGTAHDPSCPPAQDMEARFTVASIDILNEPNHLFGTLTPGNQEVLHTFMIGAQTGIVVDVYRDDGGSNSGRRDNPAIPGRDGLRFPSLPVPHVGSPYGVAC